MTLQGGNNECDHNKYCLLFYSFMTDLIQCVCRSRIDETTFSEILDARESDKAITEVLDFAIKIKPD